MAKNEGNNIKLGLFVLAGLAALIISFYIIGKNTYIFGSSFELKARFSSLDGLTDGNNVFFSGIQAGTVKSIEMINDTSIEITMLIDKNVKSYIHANAVASIGSDGLMGNKMVNIQVVKGASPLVKADDFLTAQKFVSTDEMLQTLSKTNNNIFAITQALKTTVYRLDTSAILNFLNDKNIELSVTSSLKNINGASSDALDITGMLKAIVAQIKQGRGAAGVLLTDTGFANSIKAAGAKLNLASDNINHATAQLNNITIGVSNDLSFGKGPLHALLRDSVITQKIDTSMQNVEQSSEGLNQIITALKHNFLVRGYFKRQAKQEMKEKQKKDSIK